MVGTLKGMDRVGDLLQLTQKSCNLIRLLLLNGFIVKDFKENVQHQDVLPAKGLGETLYKSYLHPLLHR